MNVYSAAWALLRRRPTAISYAFPTRVAVATICLVGGINARFILIGERPENWQMKHWGGALIPSVAAIWVMTLILWGALHWVYNARHPGRAHVNLLNLMALVLPLGGMVAGVAVAVVGILLSMAAFWLYAATM